MELVILYGVRGINITLNSGNVQMKLPKVFKFGKCEDTDMLRVPDGVEVLSDDDGALPEDVSREPALHVARRAIHSEVHCLMSEVMVGKMHGTRKTRGTEIQDQDKENLK